MKKILVNLNEYLITVTSDFNVLNNEISLIKSNMVIIRNSKLQKIKANKLN
jgi:hypothetical protein